MIKILEVVESGEADAHVASIRNGLDPSKFDVAVVPTDSLSGLRALFIERRPDVVHVHSPRAAATARAAAKSAGIKKIFYTPHGYGFLAQERSTAARVLDRLIERGAAHLGETIASSPSEAEQARGLAPRPVHLIRDAYLGNFLERKDHNDIIVGSRGAMTHALNPDAWVLLVQRLTDSRNGVGCLWIGGGEDEAKVRTNLTNMNLLMKVSVTGALVVAEERERMRGLDVFVRYSRWSASPNDLLEAMALGLPVVASDSPVHRDVVVHGETGFLVKTEVELLERCQELLDDADLRRRLGDAGRERVRREFSREKMLAELARLYSA